MKGRGEARFDHAESGIERIEIRRDFCLRRRFDPRQFQRLIEGAKLKARHAFAVLMSVDKTRRDPKTQRSNDGRGRILRLEVLKQPYFDDVFSRNVDRAVFNDAIRAQPLAHSQYESASNKVIQWVLVNGLE